MRKGFTHPPLFSLALRIANLILDGLRTYAHRSILLQPESKPCILKVIVAAFSFCFVHQEANEPKNRAERPWIITMGHRPMYCSDTDGMDCTVVSVAVSDSLSLRPTLQPFVATYVHLCQTFLCHSLIHMIRPHCFLFQRQWTLLVITQNN